MSVHSCIPVIQPNKNQFHEFMDGYFYFGKTRYIVTANRGNGVLELKKTELKSVICQTILKVVSWFTGFIPLFAAIWALKHYIHVQKASKNWSIQTNSLPNSPTPSHNQTSPPNLANPSHNQNPIQNPPNTAPTIPITNNQRTSATNSTNNDPDTLVAQLIAEEGHGQIKQLFKEKISISKPALFISWGLEETKNLNIGCRLLNQLPVDTIEHLFEMEVKIPDEDFRFITLCFDSLFQAVSKEAKEKIISGLLKNRDLYSLTNQNKLNLYTHIICTIVDGFNNVDISSNPLTQEQLDLFLIFIGGIMEREEVNGFQTVKNLTTQSFGSSLASAFIIGSLRQQMPGYRERIKEVFLHSFNQLLITPNLKAHFSDQERQVFINMFGNTTCLGADSSTLMKGL